jgi:hypothetical protein
MYVPYSLLFTLEIAHFVIGKCYSFDRINMISRIKILNIRQLAGVVIHILGLLVFNVDL